MNFKGLLSLGKPQVLALVYGDGGRERERERTRVYFQAGPILAQSLGVF
jgi:hypothetical protein